MAFTYIAIKALSVLDLIHQALSLSLSLSQHPQEQRYPFLSVRAVFSCLQTMVWPPVFEIFNERTDVDAGDCIQGQRHGQDSAVGLRVDPRLD